MNTKITNQTKNIDKGVQNNTMHNICAYTIISRQYQAIIAQKEIAKKHKLQEQKELAKKEPKIKNVYYKNLALDYINNGNIASLYTLVKSQVTRTLVRFSKISDYGYNLYKASRKHLEDSTKIELLNYDIQDLIQSGVVYIQDYIRQCNNEHLHIDYNQLIKVGYQGINKHLISSQGISIKLGAYNFSLEKMLENGCDLTIKQGIASIFNQNKYNYISLEIDFAPKQKLMLQAIKSVLLEQSLYTNRVLYFYCLGDSVRQVATRLNRTSHAIQYQIDKVRKLCYDKYNQYLNN